MIIFFITNLKLSSSYSEENIEHDTYHYVYLYKILGFEIQIKQPAVIYFISY